MGIFNFFKSKKSIKQPSEIKKISFEDVEKLLKDRSKNLEEVERETLEKLEKELEEFYISLEGKLEILEEVDIESKKEHGRAKLLVRQGLDKYINSVHILLKDLKALEKNNLEKFAREISEIFILFEKTSAKVYERATYLVGDEMVDVRNEIRKFYNGLIKIFESDKSSIQELKKIGEVKLKLNEYENIEKNIIDFKKESEENNFEIEKAKKKVRKLLEEIEKIENSSEYISNLRTEEEIKVLRMKIDKEIGMLKSLIDFKKLTNIVHTNERELKIVKAYKDHFSSEFSLDSGKRILKLLEISNMKSHEIEVQVSLIKNINGELGEKRGKVGLDSTVVKSEEVKMVEEEIENMETGAVRVKRRLEESNLKLKGLRNEVVRLIEQFDS